MESTGVYWKSPFSALEAVDLKARAVNAHHVKAVPGPRPTWPTRSRWPR